MRYLPWKFVTFNKFITFITFTIFKLLQRIPHVVSFRREMCVIPSPQANLRNLLLAALTLRRHPSCLGVTQTAVPRQTLRAYRRGRRHLGAG